MNVACAQHSQLSTTCTNAEASHACMPHHHNHHHHEALSIKPRTTGCHTFLKIEPIICFSKLLIANYQSDETLYLCLGVGADIFEGKKMKRNIQKENRSDLHNAHPNVSFKVGVVLKQVMNEFGTMKKSPLRWDHR